MSKRGVVVQAIVSPELAQRLTDDAWGHRSTLSAWIAGILRDAYEDEGPGAPPPQEDPAPPQPERGAAESAFGGKFSEATLRGLAQLGYDYGDLDTLTAANAERIVAQRIRRNSGQPDSV